MNRRILAWCWLSLGLVVLAQIVLTPRSAGPDEPSHHIRAAAIARGDVFGEPTTISGAHRSFDAPWWAGQPDPACFAFVSNTPAACASVVDTGADERISTAGSYPVWAYLLPSVTSLIPGDARTAWLARAAHALLPVTLVAFTLARLLGERRVVHAATVVLALTPTALFNMAVLNPSGIAIAGAVALWVAGDLLFDDRQRGPHDAVADGGHDRVTQWLFVGGSAAVLLPRNDGVLWWVIVVGLLMVLHRRSPRRAIGELTRSQQVVIGASLVCSVGWVVAVGTDLVEVETDLTGWRLFEAVVARTGDNLREAIGVVGWLDTPTPESMLSLWWLLLGIVGGIAFWTSARRRTAIAAAALALFVVAPWVLETAQAQTAGLFWQGRYALPVFVGTPLLLGGGRREHDGRPSERSIAILVTTGALVVANVSLWQQARRWGVGIDGSMLPWDWDTWSNPVPAIVVLLFAAAASAALGWGICARAGQSTSATRGSRFRVSSTLSP